MYVHAVLPSAQTKPNVALVPRNTNIRRSSRQQCRSIAQDPHPTPSLWLMICYVTCKTRARIRMLRISAPFLQRYLGSDCGICWFFCLIGLGLGFLLSLPL